MSDNTIKRVKSNYVGAFKNLTIQSHFQPIYSFSLERIVGYEGLLRANSHAGNVPPLTAFSQCLNKAETIQLDRLSRALHLLNFKCIQQRNHWIFINLRGEEIIDANMDPTMLIAVLKKHGYRPEQIVLEILEDVAIESALLTKFVTNYQRKGFMIAIDDFGAGYSNFDRIWKLHPNIVKLDRSMISNAVKQSKARRIFTRLVSLLRETESLVLIEGVETQDEALLALDSGADMVQGFYFSKPHVLDENKLDAGALLFAPLEQQLLQQKNVEKQIKACSVQQFDLLLGQCANQLQLGQSFQSACRQLTYDERCGCVFLLNEEGYQVDVMLPPSLTAGRHRFLPFTQSHGANWKRRAYFSHAISALGKVFISEPYLALPDVKMKVTCSLAFYAKGQTYVLCCDIDDNEFEVNKMKLAV